MSLVSASTPIVPVENMATLYQHAPRLLLPDPRQLFRQRSRRLAQLAEGHELSVWLLFCHDLSEVQHRLANTLNFPLSIHGVPPINIQDWQAGNPSWVCWQRLLEHMAARSVDPARVDLIHTLQAWTSMQWQQQAKALLLGSDDSVSPEAAPFLGAALQVEWVSLASQLPQEIATAHQGEAALCPVCGSHPAVSMVHIGDPMQGVRYLVCSLCNSQWHAARAKCTNCDSPEEIALLGQTQQSAIQGECCDACHSYVKWLSQLRDVHLDPCADDLASLVLDMTLAQAGYGRAARNLFLIGTS